MIVHIFNISHIPSDVKRFQKISLQFSKKYAIIIKNYELQPFSHCSPDAAQDENLLC